ncbi:MAG: hypothetical protein NTV54_06350 [Ignavibacteriales bacterium]|nr:hypothetical protein [Ignavibacteriales bacterium]
MPCLFSLVALSIVACASGGWDPAANRAPAPVTVLAADTTWFAGIPDERIYDRELISGTLKASTYKFSNRLMYRDTAGWKGRIVEIFGFFPGTSPRAQEFATGNNEFYLSGGYDGAPTRAVVKIDHPLPQRRVFGQGVPYFSSGNGMRVFGRILGLKHMIDDSGLIRGIIELECLMIYAPGDYYRRNPLWVTGKYELLPDGNVTTDTLIYEFDKSK